MPSSSFPSTTSATANSKPVGSASSLLEAFLKEDPDEKAAALESVASKWRDAHRRLHPVWAECLGMTYSDQYGSYSNETRTWNQRDPAPEKKITRIELNHMRTIAFDVASLQCQDPPNMRADAGTDSSASALAKLAADQLVWYLWEADGYDDKNFALREAAAVVGNWFLYPFWDMSDGRLVEQVIGYEDEPVSDPLTGMPIGMRKKPVMGKVREGKFADRLVSCFDGLPDPNSKAEWDGEGFIVQERLPLETLRRLYPEHKDDLVTDKGTGSNDGSFYTERMKGISPRTGGMGGYSQEQSTESVTVFTVFLRTCEEFYRGRWAVVACGKLLYEKDNPVYPTEVEEQKGEEFPQEHWPIYRFGHEEVPGSYWMLGVAVGMIGAQRKLNGIASKKLHMLKRICHPTLVKPKRADFVKSDEPDQQINVADSIPAGAIYYLQSPGIPQELQMEERLSVEQMERIAGLHAGSRGQSENGDSGTKQRQLFQRDLGRLAVPKYRADKQLGKAFAYKLRLWRRYATTERTIRIVGENNATEVKSFDMASIAPGTGIQVYQDTGMPRDPSARMLHLEKAVQLGIVDPKDPIQRAQMAALIGVGGSTRMFESQLIADRRNAEKENLKFYEGKPSAVEFWHDDLQHLAAHFTEMNSEQWQDATTPGPNDDPMTAMKKQQVRALYEAHVQKHQLQIQMKSGGMQPTIPGPGAPTIPPSTSPMGGPPSPSPAPSMGGGAPPAPMPAPGPDLSMVPAPQSPQAPAGPPMQIAA